MQEQLELLVELEAQREAELGEARAIQMGMVPRGPLRTREVTICHEFQPYHEVGGDFLDFFTLTDGSIGLYLGDVTGKGLGAALYAAVAVGTLRGVHKTGTDPATVLAQLNRRMMLHHVSHRYAAVQYMCFDARTGIMRIAGAGMQGPLHLSARGYRELQLRGLPPGMFPTASYESEALRLEPGDSVIFCSDGFSDTQNPAGEFFGTEGLEKVCAPLRGLEPEAVLKAMCNAATAHGDGQTQQDDRTAAVLRYLPS